MRLACGTRTRSVVLLQRATERLRAGEERKVQRPSCWRRSGGSRWLSPAGTGHHAGGGRDDGRGLVVGTSRWTVDVSPSTKSHVAGTARPESLASRRQGKVPMSRGPSQWQLAGQRWPVNLVATWWQQQRHPCRRRLALSRLDADRHLRRLERDSPLRWLALYSVKLCSSGGAAAAVGGGGLLPSTFRHPRTLGWTKPRIHPRLKAGRIAEANSLGEAAAAAETTVAQELGSRSQICFLSPLGTEETRSCHRRISATHGGSGRPYGGSYAASAGRSAAAAWRCGGERCRRGRW